MLRRFYLPAVALTLSTLVPSAVRADEMLTFEKHVLPIFDKHCTKCHNLRKPIGGLDLSSLGTAKKGGDTGRGIVPGELDGGHVWRMVSTGEMPPKGEALVAKKDKDTIKQWIQDGAKDDEQVRAIAADKSTPQERLRGAIQRAVDALKSSDRKLPERFESPASDRIEEFNEKVIELQKDVGLLMYQLTSSLDELKELAAERNRSTRTWQATCDFTVARLQARTAALGEYNFALGQMRKDPPRPDPKFKTGVELAVRPQLNDRESQKMALVARRTLEKLAQEHSGTTWELLARRQLLGLGALGLEWQPFTDTKDRKPD
jgi:hypothetical protein